MEWVSEVEGSNDRRVFAESALAKSLHTHIVVMSELEETALVQEAR